MVLQTATMDYVELHEVKLFANRGVTLLSPYAAIEPISNIQRFDRKANRHVQIDCLSMVVQPVHGRR